MSKRAWKWLLTGVLALLVSPLFAPQLLAFPHSAKIAGHQVYSEAPIGPELRRIVAVADAKLAASELGAKDTADDPIFLTKGGWRWVWLANRMRGAFALTRP